MLLDKTKQNQTGGQQNLGSPKHTERVRTAADARISPPKKWITPEIIRVKQPEADLQLAYRRVLNICMGITLVLHTSIALVFPRFESEASEIKKIAHVIEIQDLPETQQIKRPPPPPRPAVPIETESDDIPDDVTIESTDLDFDDAQVDLPPPPPPGSRDQGEAEEEIVEFWAVEQAPTSIKQAAPVYPEVARKAGLTGTVFVEFTVGRDGFIKGARVIRGPAIFHDAALNAVFKFTFKPAMQNDKPVSVRMTQAIRFRLKESQ
ncbi:MAG: energy transducer TonB [Candidatus Latescibacteria bacterium]|nr:energy transducer TonB [Candidatus Latescibacterota bacterium]